MNHHVPPNTSQQIYGDQSFDRPRMIHHFAADVWRVMFVVCWSIKPRLTLAIITLLTVCVCVCVCVCRLFVKGEENHFNQRQNQCRAERVW